MIVLKQYDDLGDVLLHLKMQVMDSLEFAIKTVPNFAHPKPLFYWLKDRVTYMNDPHSIELLMTMETMFNGSRTGTCGGGDCDDFTITSLACLIACNMHKNDVVLVGKNDLTPVHIYVRTEHEGEKYWFDLTNNEFDVQRYTYKYQQILKFQI